MVVGTYFRRFGGSAQYSPTFGRGGLAALFAVEILACDASTSLTVTIEHCGVPEMSVRFGGRSAGRDGKCEYKGHVEWRSVTQWILTGRGAPPTLGRNFIDKVEGRPFADSSYKDPTPADSRRWSDGGRLERLCKP